MSNHARTKWSELALDGIRTTRIVGSLFIKFRIIQRQASKTHPPRDESENFTPIFIQ